MAVSQIVSAVQNDGNYAQLDLQDMEFAGPLMRIETFRCSQPTGPYGTTAAGTTVSAVAGADHLSATSNRVFRHVFSVDGQGAQRVTLEFRESYAQDGSCEVRCRDVDVDSPSFGRVVVVQARPQPGERYQLYYYVTAAPAIVPALITSPMTSPMTDLVPGLVDIGAPLGQLGPPDGGLGHSSVVGTIHWPSGAIRVQNLIGNFAANFAEPDFARWMENFRVYLRFGDFRDKCVHPGINLIGPHEQLASEYLLLRAYRASMILLGLLFDPDMTAAATGGFSFLDSADPLSVDPKPGVYSVFLTAYILGIEIYQLGLDKVHSDYGGIPMAQAPGSRLENGTAPFIDATRFNRTLAELAFAFYVASSPSSARMTPPPRSQ